MLVYVFYCSIWIANPPLQLLRLEPESYCWRSRAHCTQVNNACTDYFQDRDCRARPHHLQRRSGPVEYITAARPDGRLRLRNLLDDFRPRYDLLLIDTQGARSVLVEMAILACDIALSPITPEMLAARELRRGTLRLFSDLESFRHLGITPPPLRLLLNQVNSIRVDTRMIIRDLRETFAGATNISVLETIVPDRVAYLNAASLGLPVHRIETRRSRERRSPPALETMQALAIELSPEWREAISTVNRCADVQ